MQPYTYLIGWSKHQKFYYGMFPSLKEAALAEPKKVHSTTINNRINNIHNVNYERIEV